LRRCLFPATCSQLFHFISANCESTYADIVVPAHTRMAKYEPREHRTMRKWKGERNEWAWGRGGDLPSKLHKARMAAETRPTIFYTADATLFTSNSFSLSLPIPLPIPLPISLPIPLPRSPSSLSTSSFFLGYFNELLNRPLYY
jgi:hypothetical protein